MSKKMSKKFVAVWEIELESTNKEDAEIELGERLADSQADDQVYSLEESFVIEERQENKN